MRFQKLIQLSVAVVLSVLLSGAARAATGGEPATVVQVDVAACLAAIAADPSIEEVILSGGDPLSLTDARLHSLTQQLALIPHLRRLRLHTRLPVVLPARVDAGLTQKA